MGTVGGTIYSWIATDYIPAVGNPCGQCVEVFGERYGGATTFCAELGNGGDAVTNSTVGGNHEVVQGVATKFGSGVSGVADTRSHNGVATSSPIADGVADTIVHVVRPNEGDAVAVDSSSADVSHRVATVVLSDDEIVDEEGILATGVGGTEGHALAGAGIVGIIDCVLVVVLLPVGSATEGDKIDGVHQSEGAVALNHTGFQGAGVVA